MKTENKEEKILKQKIKIRKFLYKFLFKYININSK